MIDIGVMSRGRDRLDLDCMEDKRGVSVLVGFVLVLLMLMLFLSLLQTQMIPNVCKNVELKNLNRITEELENLNRDILEDRLTTVTLSLGVIYPKYPLLLSPPDMATEVLSVPFTMNVSYDEVLPNGSIIHRSVSERTCSVVLNLNYFYHRGYKMVLENTALFRKVDGRTIPIVRQNMFGRGIVRIVFVNASFTSFTADQPIDVSVIPVSYGGSITAKNVTVSFTTTCPDYWISEAPKLSKLGYNVTVNGNLVVVRFDNFTELYMSYVSLSMGTLTTALSPLKPLRIVPINPTTKYTLTLGSSIVLGVKVVDTLENPVGGVRINVTLSGVGSVDKNSLYTDSNGEAFVTYVANETGEAVVNFSTSFGHVFYTIIIPTISTGGVSGVIYDAKNVTVLAYGNYTSSNPPTTYDITPNTPFPNVDAIKNVDGVYLESVAIYYDHASQKFIFEGLSTNALLTEIFWYGKGIGYYTNGTSIYVWNYNKSEYDLVGYTGGSGTGWVTAVLYPKNLKDYIRDGKMTILVVQNGITYYGRMMYVEYSELYTDYIGVLQVG